MSEYICFSDEVRKALDAHKPLVAIETGGTFEGIPYPENVETAMEVMESVRQAGTVPAYISIMDGKVKVGMTAEEVDASSLRRRKLLQVQRKKLTYRSRVSTFLALMRHGQQPKRYCKYC